MATCTCVPPEGFPRNNAFRLTPGKMIYLIPVQPDAEVLCRASSTWVATCKLDVGCHLRMVPYTEASANVGRDYIFSGLYLLKSLQNASAEAFTSVGEDVSSPNAANGLRISIANPIVDMIFGAALVLHCLHPVLTA